MDTYSRRKQQKVIGCKWAKVNQYTKVLPRRFWKDIAFDEQRSNIRPLKQAGYKNITQTMKNIKTFELVTMYEIINNIIQT